MRHLACPLDGSTLHETARSGVLVDVCPSCRGVWLDRGELDKVIERSNESNSRATAPPAPAAGSAPVQAHSYDRDRDPAEWPRDPDGTLGMTLARLDLEGLLAELADEGGSVG